LNSPAPKLARQSPKQQRLNVAWLSFAAGIFMLVLKMGAYLLTGSHAILSDAMESVVHIAATGFVVFCVIYSERPADEDHPYGHGKIESFSVGFEGGLIFLAGLSILWETSRGALQGHQVQKLETGMLMIGLSAAINVILATYIIRKGKEHQSKILEADGKHVLSDAVTSIGVILGVVIVMITQLTWIDSAIAVLVSFHLLHTGYQLIKEAIKDLMDEVDPKVMQTIVDTLNRLRHKDWLDIHLLRVYQNGKQHHIDFHLVIPGDWNVCQAHDEMDRIELNILKDLNSGGSVLIHLDPKLDPELADQVEDENELAQRPLTIENTTRTVLDPELDAIRNLNAD
jgi:cation diffusion facilitator family transporter